MSKQYMEKLEEIVVLSFDLFDEDPGDEFLGYLELMDCLEAMEAGGEPDYGIWRRILMTRLRCPETSGSKLKWRSASACRV